MKKLLVAILAVLYIGTSTGATIHLHYCMGKLAGWGLEHNNSKTCSKCGMEKSDEKGNDCCKDEYKFIKSTTDQKTTQSNFQFVQLIALASPVAFVEIPSYDFPSVSGENPINQAPFLTCGVSAYIRNCVFLI